MRDWHNGYDERYFGFEDSGVGTGSINSVTLYLEVYGLESSTVQITAYINDVDMGEVTCDADVYAWETIDVSSELDTWEKIDDATLWLEITAAGNYRYCRRAYLYVDYEAGGEPSHTDATLEETIAVTSSLDSEKSLNRYSSETIEVTSSASTTKTLYRSSGSSFTVETTTATQKDLGAIFIEQFETVTITVGLYTTKHIAATLIELTETLTIIANLYTSLLVELTTSDLLGLIIVFSVIALAIALCALGLHFKKK